MSRVGGGAAGSNGGKKRVYYVRADEALDAAIEKERDESEKKNGYRPSAQAVIAAALRRHFKIGARP